MPHVWWGQKYRAFYCESQLQRKSLATMWLAMLCISPQRLISNWQKLIVLIPFPLYSYCPLKMASHCCSYVSKLWHNERPHLRFHMVYSQLAIVLPNQKYQCRASQCKNDWIKSFCKYLWVPRDKCKLKQVDVLPSTNLAPCS